MRVRSVSVVIAILLMVMAVTLASASPAGIGNPILRMENGGTSLSAVIYSDGITDGGAAGNGAISWDVFFLLPLGVTVNDFTVTPGQVWIDQCPGAFGTAKTPQTSPVPGFSAFYINGFCTTTRTGPAVTGSNVPVATLTFTDLCANTGAFNVNLHTGGDPAGDLTDMFDTDNELHMFPDSALTDGGSLCGPTAVALSGLQTETSSNTATYGLLLALAALAAIVVGASVVLRRRSAAKN